VILSHDGWRKCISRKGAWTAKWLVVAASLKYHSQHELRAANSAAN
jgi:hypothetical protein